MTGWVWMCLHDEITPFSSPPFSALWKMGETVSPSLKSISKYEIWGEIVPLRKSVL